MIKPSMYAIDALQLIADESNRNKKIELFKEACEKIAGFKRGCELALDFRYKFGMTKIPAYKANSTPDSVGTLSYAIEQLMPLIRRDIKGVEASEYLAKRLELFEAKDSQFIERIVLKDLQCGIGKESFSSIFPNVLLDVPVSLPSKYDNDSKGKIAFPAIVQSNFNGVRAILELNVGKEAILHLRSGNTIPIPSHLADDVKALEARLSARNPGMVFDGELIANDPTVVKKFIKRQSTNVESIRFIVSDLTTVASWHLGLDTTPYNIRLELLQKLLPEIYSANQHIQCIASQLVRDEQTLNTLYERSVEVGNDGIIVRDPRAPWKPGKTFTILERKLEK